MNDLRIGSLCAGYGGLEEGVRSVLGGDVVWQSEINPGACKILAHRYPGVPNIGDMTKVDWSQVEPVDVLCGGTPCQDLSHAGKRAGMTEGTRSNLWVAMREAIAKLRPSLVVWENVRGALSACADSELGPCPGCVDERHPHRPLLRAAGRVLGDLASLGFDAEWAGFPASDIGAPHGRFRIFVVAWPADTARHPWRLRDGDDGSTGDSPLRGRHGARAAGGRGERPGPTRGSDRPTIPHSQGERRGEGGAESARLLRGSDTALSGAQALADAYCSGCEACGGRPRPGNARRRQPVVDCGTDWGIYGPAVRRWERITRPAPAPVEQGAKGQTQLSPAFVEWMQGLPPGWVTDPAIWRGMPYSTARNAQLHALGNGVIPQQAAAALRLLLPNVGEVAA